MKDALGVANYFIPTVHDAGSMPLGMASDEENSRTWSPAEEAALTSQQIANGRAENVTAEITPARSGPDPVRPMEGFNLDGDALVASRRPRLTDEQAKFMARIKNTRSHGYMLTMEDADILIQIIEELTK